jgi:hypothetical protein
MAKIPDDPKHFLKVAQSHLARVEKACAVEDWSDLGTYGLYCLEALVRAAALKSGETPVRTHYGKIEQAANLSRKHGLPDIAELLQDLNVARKATAYGDEEFDTSLYDAEQMTRQIKEYYEKVSAFLEQES